MIGSITVEDLFLFIEEALETWIYEHSLEDWKEFYLGGEVPLSDLAVTARKRFVWNDIIQKAADEMSDIDACALMDCDSEKCEGHDSDELSDAIEELWDDEAIITEAGEEYCVQTVYDAWADYWSIGGLIDDAQEALDRMREAEGMDRLYAALAACHVYHANGRLVRDHADDNAAEFSRFVLERIPEKAIQEKNEIVLKLAIEGLSSVIDEEEIKEWIEQNSEVV